ncbi:MAG: multidrug resistance protein NorM [Pseudomonadota bacterium]|jgi:MATE family multidrug resistance protein
MPTPVHRFTADARRILTLAWPVIIGQLAVLAFGTLDTVLLARHATADLAALAVGGSAYIIVFIGLMGVVTAVSPIVGRLHGAGRHAEAGRQLWQALWLAGGLTGIGALALLWPDALLRASRLSPALDAQVRTYLAWLALALPAALGFAAFRGFSNAISRPRVVMRLQLGGLALKAPLAWALVGGVPALGVPALGITGCGISTVVAFWAQALAAIWLARRDPQHHRHALGARGAWRPDPAALKALLRLGIPMGAGIAVEITGFAAMALFIARLGETAVAGHQIATNLVGLLFMLPLGLSHGTAALVAQRIGAQDLADARRIGHHGLLLALGLALLAGGAVWLLRGPIVGLYTDRPDVAVAALPLLSWVLVFHAVDAVQTLTAFVLRAWHVALLPMGVYLLAVWGVGLGGGQWLAFGADGGATAAGAWLARWPADWQGARGFWIASTAGLGLAAVTLTLLQWRVTRRAAASVAG